ncbi:hypothetical protein VTK26DRAFT_4125 [Humicola hyalothermophila]
MGSVNAPVPASSLSNDVLLIAVFEPPDEKWMAKIEARYPGLKVRWVVQGDHPEPLPAEVFDGVTLLCTLFPSSYPPDLLKRLRYVQLISAGADRWTQHELYKNPDVLFCTANGVHAIPIAEWVVTTFLMANHRFLAYAAQQAKATWFRLPNAGVTDAAGMRMGILGYGAIGRQVARLAAALGIEVYAYARSARPDAASRRDDDSYRVPGTGDPEGAIPAKWFHGGSREEVNAFLAQDLDVLVLSLPLTDATRHVLGREQFEILARKRTFVVNVARGAVVDTDALVEALKEGKIRGAALDVTDPEPLPDGHPLWSAENCFITPHVSWQTPRLYERIKDLLEQNLERLAQGKRMINAVDRVNQY